jgi:hypothetical protein
MCYGTVNDPLKAGGGLRVAMIVEHETREFVVDIPSQLFPQQVEIDVAGSHDGSRVAIVQERQEQMLKRRILVTSLVRVLERASECLL